MTCVSMSSLGCLISLRLLCIEQKMNHYTTEDRWEWLAIHNHYRVADGVQNRDWLSEKSDASWKWGWRERRGGERLIKPDSFFWFDKHTWTSAGQYHPWHLTHHFWLLIGSHSRKWVTKDFLKLFSWSDPSPGLSLSLFVSKELAHSVTKGRTWSKSGFKKDCRLTNIPLLQQKKREACVRSHWQPHTAAWWQWTNKELRSGTMFMF